MPENRRIGTLMVPLAEYPSVYDDDSLKDAVIALNKHRTKGEKPLHRSVLVFSRTRKVQGEELLVGILTIRDILATIQKNIAISENYTLQTMGWAYFYRRDPLMQSLITRVRQSVRPLVKAYAQVDDAATKAIEIMMTGKVNLVPVFSGKKAVGIVRSIDILDYIADMLVDGR